MDKGNALSNMFANLLSAVNLSRIGKQPQPVQLSTGNIIIQGNADQSVVQALNRYKGAFKKEMISELTRIGEKFRR